MRPCALKGQRARLTDVMLQHRPVILKLIRPERFVVLVIEVK
jgi:hypothetical protein